MTTDSERRARPGDSCEHDRRRRAAGRLRRGRLQRRGRGERAADRRGARRSGDGRRRAAPRHQGDRERLHGNPIAQNGQGARRGPVAGDASVVQLHVDPGSGGHGNDLERRVAVGVGSDDAQTRSSDERRRHPSGRVRDVVEEVDRHEPGEPGIAGAVVGHGHTRERLDERPARTRNERQLHPHGKAGRDRRLHEAHTRRLARLHENAIDRGTRAIGRQRERGPEVGIADRWIEGGLGLYAQTNLRTRWTAASTRLDHAIGIEAREEREQRGDRWTVRHVAEHESRREGPDVGGGGQHDVQPPTRRGRTTPDRDGPLCHAIGEDCRRPSDDEVGLLALAEVVARTRGIVVRGSNEAVAVEIGEREDDHRNAVHLRAQERHAQAGRTIGDDDGVGHVRPARDTRSARDGDRRHGGRRGHARARRGRA